MAFSQEGGSAGVVLDCCVHSAHHLPVLRDNLFTTYLESRESSKKPLAGKLLRRTTSFTAWFDSCFVAALVLVDLIVDLENKVNF